MIIIVIGTALWQKGILNVPLSQEVLVSDIQVQVEVMQFCITLMHDSIPEIGRSTSTTTYFNCGVLALIISVSVATVLYAGVEILEELTEVYVLGV